MKLRNKKTGEIKTSVHLSWFDGTPERFFQSLEEAKAELEEWEDYKEPLIKDEKIRKAVRAWAEANDLDDIICFVMPYGFMFAGNATRLEICIGQTLDIDTTRRYTIEELCGEEE